MAGAAQSVERVALTKSTSRSRFSPAFGCYVFGEVFFSLLGKVGSGVMLESICRVRVSFACL